MVFTMGGIAFVPNIFGYWSCSFLNGVLRALLTVLPIIASQVPKEKIWLCAIGNGNWIVVAGNLMGP